MLHHLSRAIHCVRCRDPIYRVRGVGRGTTLVTLQPLSCPDMLTKLAIGIIYRVRGGGVPARLLLTNRHPVLVC